MGARQKFALTTVAAVCAAGVLAACADTVDGSGSVSRTGVTAGPSGAPGSTGSTPTGFPSSGSAGSTGALSGFLVPAPAGSEHGSSTWANTTSPTLQQFVSHFYDSDQVTAEVARLTADGFSAAAHRLWIKNDIQVDVVLLRFDSASGALTRHTGIVTATRSDSTLRSVTPSIAGDVTEFYTTKVDKLGNIASRSYAIKGDVTVETFLFSPKTFDEKDLTAYTGAQVAKLP